MRAKRPEFILAATTILISTVSTLLVLELLARSFVPMVSTEYIPSNNARLIYELNPQYPGINSYGMRQAEFDPSTLRDQFVIAVIGDSHTYSVDSARHEDSFPARLEHHLRAYAGRPVKVLNFGVPGYNMAQELQVLKTKALPFRPDLVILQYCINDEHISNYIQPKHAWLNRAIHQSVLLTRGWKRLLYSRVGIRYLFPFVEEYLPDLLLISPGLVGTQKNREADPERARHPPRTRDQVPTRYHDFIGKANFERDVKSFGKILQDARIPATATGFIEDEHRVLYEASGFRVYSFRQIFQHVDMRDYGYNPNNTATHFSDRGSDFIGKALAEFVSTHFVVSQE